MICPNCESEYREGYHRCAECDVDLIDSDLVDPSATDSELIRVFETDIDKEFATMVISVLQNRNIPFLFQEGTAFDTFGIVDRNQNLVWRGALWVPQSYKDETEKIIDELKVLLMRQNNVELQE